MIVHVKQVNSAVLSRWQSRCMAAFGLKPIAAQGGFDLPDIPGLSGREIGLAYGTQIALARKEGEVIQRHRERKLRWRAILHQAIRARLP